MKTISEITPALCDACQAGPCDAEGHALLTAYVAGPFPGQNIYRCTSCDDRWIRHYGGTWGTYAWTRYADQFPSAVRRPISARKAGVQLPF